MLTTADVLDKYLQSRLAFDSTKRVAENAIEVKLWTWDSEKQEGRTIRARLIVEDVS